MVKTLFQRVEIDQPDVAVFRVSGKLGFHQNNKIEQLVEECLRREFRKVVFDFLDLSSLGGGVARIFRDFVIECGRRECSVSFVVTNKVVLDFLRSGDVDVSIYPTLEAALDASKEPSPHVEKDNLVGKEEDRAGGKDTDEIIMMMYNDDSSNSGGGEESDEESSDILQEENPTNKEVDSENMTFEQGSNIEESKDKNGIDSTEDASELQLDKSGGIVREKGKEEIISEIFNNDEEDVPPEWIEAPTSPFNEKDKVMEKTSVRGKGDINRNLRRRLLELKTLFSISSDFNEIRNKKKFLDIFLLTAIAQGGVESALFLEKKDDYLIPVVSKGIEKANIEGLRIDINSIKDGGRKKTLISIDSIVGENEKQSLKANDFEYFCPFTVNNDLVGLFVIGKRLSGHDMEKENFEFLNILASVAESAYRNAVMFERKDERTLGIVKTLISMIEENTLLKGTSEFVSRYVGVLAKKLNYPEEHFKDLIYGTVLRDMGMIKISDLIVKSPRELSKEEWTVIKKHPGDGAEMLRRMGFDDHVVEIVRNHHERFNGEGYPRGLRGKEIPLGARIISVVESYSAMIHDRPTRAALSKKEALKTLKENYGLRYDREVTLGFAKIIERELAKSLDPKAVMTKG
jgi:HD-GYP domain-containing protein (c-di-GMP phosphodiesterase class II)/anti-anti-sigma regulatory factor